MAFNPYYAPYSRPMGYYNPSIPQEQGQQQFQQPMQQFQQHTYQQQQPSNDMIWVLSEVEAQSYPVAPNNSVILWDKTNDVIYIKSANMQGVPSMRILDYVERTPETAQKTPEKQCGGKYVSIETFKALQSDFEALRNDFEELKNKPKQKTKTKAEDVNDGE